MEVVSQHVAGEARRSGAGAVAGVAAREVETHGGRGAEGGRGHVRGQEPAVRSNEVWDRNYAASVSRPARDLDAEHERCVLAFAIWIVKPRQSDLRSRIRRRLAGKRLACHCRGRPCHGEILAALANQPRETIRAIQACTDCS